MLSEKRRLLKSDDVSHRQKWQTVSGGQIYYDSGWANFNYKLYSWQITQSEGHRWPKGRGVRDVGGPFNTVKSDYSISHSKNRYVFDFTHGLYKEFYDGGVISHNVVVPELSTWRVAEPSMSQLISVASKSGLGSDTLARGTKMIASSIPTNPVVDGSVGLAELFREGIPSMIGSSILKAKAGFFRDLGSEYLNYEFGWKPLIQDLRDASKAIVESETILKQLVRDSGKNVRRQRHLPIEQQVDISYSNTGYPRGTEDAAWWATPRATLTDKYWRSTWFSGCYTFEYDPGNLTEISRIATQARLLYGLELNPEVLWNLAPWSWLVDWFANVGPLLNNVSAFQNDQLVLRYGYVMDRHKRDLIQGVEVNRNHPGNILPESYTEQHSCEWKSRAQATPYGFGVASSSFTLRQWAILSALGITRT
jgi:hypothetical protein